MTMLREGRHPASGSTAAPLAGEKVEVAALVGLADVLGCTKRRSLARSIFGGGLHACFRAAASSSSLHFELKPPSGYVEGDQVAVSAPSARGPPTKDSGATCSTQVP